MSTTALTSDQIPAQSRTINAPAKRWRAKANPWAIAITVTLATFMEVLDTSIANVALPHIAGGLGASQDEATWVLTSYLVANAVILPASSYLTTFIGRKKFYLICVVLFCISSMLCGLAPSLPLLIFFRVLQGAGGGGLAPSEQAILADTFPPEKRGQAMALYGLAVVTAPAIGPTLGGWITDNYDWRWIFFINVPVALVSLFLTARLVEDPPWVTKEVALGKVRGLNLDYFGFALLAIGFGSLEFVLDKGQEDDWFGSHIIAFFIVTCAIALITLIFWSLRQIGKGHRPILNLTLFKRKTFAISFMFMFVLGFALYGTTVLIPQFVQLLLGYTAELAGFAMSPGGLMTMLMMPLVGFLIGKVDVRYLMGFGFFIVGIALLVMHSLNLQISYGYIAMMRVFQASGLAFLFVPINTISYTGVPHTQNNDVSGLTNLARNIGGSCGTAFVATELARRTQAHMANMTRNLTPSDPAFQQRIHALSRIFANHGLVPNANAGGFMAQAYIYQQMFRQAQMLSYLDIIAMLSIGCFLMLPFVAFLGKLKKPSGDAPMH
jgi:DHA2 family multidrug resistance protein